MLASHKQQFKEFTEQLLVRGNIQVSSAKRTLWTVSFLIYLLNHRKLFPAWLTVMTEKPSDVWLMKL